jgi:hypothetical protein
MTRWFTALLYALMLACAALPAQAALAVGAFSVDAGAVAMADDAADQQDSKAAAPATDQSAHDASADTPELFFDRLPCLTLPMQQAEAPPSISAALSPPPCLKGPQRPPRALA